MAQLIRWMSIQQTAILSIIAAVVLPVLMLCIFRAYRNYQRAQFDPQSAEENNRTRLVCKDGQNFLVVTEGAAKQSPLTFRNLLTRHEQKQISVRTPTSSPRPCHDYLYDSDTPSFAVR